MSLKGPIISIEDDEDDQFLLQQAVKGLAIANPVRFFSNGPAALDYLQHTSEQPFLILCDINMPVLNGLEVRQHINASAYLKEKAIPFVFLTTTASETTVREAYQTNVQGFYEKESTLLGLQQQLGKIIAYWQTSLHPNSFKR